MNKYLIANFNDYLGSTFCIFHSEVENQWNLTDCVSSNTIDPIDGIEKIAVKIENLSSYDLVTGGSNTVRDLLKERFGNDIRMGEPEGANQIVEMLRSKKLTIERRISQDVSDDLNDPQRLENSRLLKTIGLACRSILNPIYPSSFGGDPIDEDPYKRFSRW
ncbi:hypothetical protein [Chamaesiphon sp.]|uniref:hypothetical protein n=1 Tax=Chamaesiphon sp. TaxID=2814140 RepID=UPI003593BE5D